jgi:ATP-dependent RNA helicase DeaD
MLLDGANVRGIGCVGVGVGVNAGKLGGVTGARLYFVTDFPGDFRERAERRAIDKRGIVEQDIQGEGAARSQHVVHVLPSDDRRIAGIVRTQVERLTPRDEQGGLRLLVLTPSATEAAALASEVNDGLDASGALLMPLTTEGRGGRRLALGAPCAVASADLALALVKRSTLKLDTIETVVLVALEVLAVTANDAVEAILSEAPRDADRVAVAADLSPVVESLLERHARKARRVHHDLPAPSEAKLEYVVCDEETRTDILGRLLDSIDPAHTTVISSEEDAEAACAALARLGYGPDDELVSYSDGDTPDAEALVVLFGAPAGPDDITQVLDAAPERVVVLVAPHDVTAFLRVFGARARPVSTSALVEIAGSMEDAVRGEIRGVIGSASLHREVLSLAPLFSDRDPVEVAAALLRMYEQARADAQVAAAPPVRVVAARVERSHEEPARAPAREDRPRAPRTRREAPASTSGGEWSAIYVNIGARDGAQKGDLVGAIAGESGISSEQIGRITLRDTFSIVEIGGGVAEQVLEAINGKTIRGRTISARPDRMVEERPARGRPERTRDGGRGFDRERGRERPAGGGRSASGGGARSGPRSARPTGGFQRSRDTERPRSFRDDDRARGPRAIRESREWGERGERLRNARRPRRERDE